MNMHVHYIVLVCVFVFGLSQCSPVPEEGDFIRSVEPDTRPVSDIEDGDIAEPMIQTWPDLPIAVETAPPESRSLIDEVEDDAMSYILTENRNLLEGPYGFIYGDIYIGPTLPRNSITNMNLRWPNGVVPYEIHYIFGSGARAQIRNAISQYDKYTCIKWTPRANQADYVRFVPKSGCWSAVGRIGGMQELSVGGTCTWYKGTIMHEMMHASGFHHEQSRNDRDNHVTIYRQNIQRGMEHNFEKYNLNTLGTQYDYASIMHYPRNAFSWNGQDTIVPRQNIHIGNRNSFSELDIYELNKLYECGGGGGGGEVGGVCSDKANRCANWAWHGYCYGEWMLQNCKESCGLCVACSDSNVDCEWWANQGFCTGRYSQYMNKNCKNSCGLLCN